LSLATQYGLTSIAFPSISTGAYGFPLELAAPIAINTVREYTRANDNLKQVVFCCFSPHDLAVYLRVLGAPHGS
jgi:O-acetyl-ADP-ribose deacetylase (regulator of RNase III)